MRVKVTLATRKETFRFGEVEIPEGMTVMDCLKMLYTEHKDKSLPDIDLYSEDSVASVNARVAYYDTVLHDGDELYTIPFCVGG